MNGQTGVRVRTQRGATAAPPAPERLTRAQQREATRHALLDATAACLIEEGYRGLTTRTVAERAGVSQSTVMHHFPNRDAFIVEAVMHLARRLTEEGIAQIDLSDLRRPEHREAVLDQTWRQFTSPEALAASQLWHAAWTEPELVPTLQDLERRTGSILFATAGTLFPDQADDPRLPALVDTAVSAIRGLSIAIPITGRDVAEARWSAIKQILLRAAADVLDED